MSRERLERTFPHLARFGYKITSPADPTYNCVAWAAADTENWWEPEEGTGLFWPADVMFEWTLEACQDVYHRLGYVLCQDSNLEPDFDKIAIYFDIQRRPTHVAKQLPNGRWSSKIGSWEDIEHALMGLSGREYGTPMVFMRRRRTP